MAKSVLQGGDDVADGLPLVSPEEQVSSVMQQQTAQQETARQARLHGSDACNGPC
jgi:hypothetical protein